MNFLAVFMTSLAFFPLANASDLKHRAPSAKNGARLQARPLESSQGRPYIFLTGPKAVIVPCVEEASSKTTEEALLISSAALAQKEFLCVDVRKPTNELGLKMCRDGRGNDLMLGASSSKLECLKVLDSIIQATAESKPANTQSAP